MPPLPEPVKAQGSVPPRAPLAGALIGAAVAENQAQYYHPPPGGYPVARSTGTPGYVYSPYPPHNVIDVRGVPQGAMVRDPSTGGIFIKP